MDPIRLKVLQAELQAQWGVVEEVYALLEVRAERLDPADPVPLESLAYQLHNLYSALEDLFEVVADTFENSVIDTSRWHSQLLQRMRLEIEGVRPALVSPELYPLLDELRAFRHFFRHAYQSRLAVERVRFVLARARQAKPLLQRDLAQFVGRLQPDD